MTRVEGKPEFQRLRQEWAIKRAALNERHESEDDELRAAYIEALGPGLSEHEIEVELWVLVDEVFPSHNLNRHEHYQRNPEMQSESRDNFYRDHPEFVDGEER
ncbi:MAG: hypothetical protein ACYDCH_09645 [Gaiellaceae bacterium]